jgi:arginase
MSNPLVIIGAPSSAGAYSPGQEKAPDALRASGLVDLLNKRGVKVRDLGNVPGFRWRIDRSNMRAMNVERVAEVAKATASQVVTAFRARIRWRLHSGARNNCWGNRGSR